MAYKQDLQHVAAPAGAVATNMRSKSHDELDDDSILAKLETILSEPAGEIDSMVEEELSKALKNSQNHKWAEMIGEIQSNLDDISEFVVDIKGDSQTSF